MNFNNMPARSRLPCTKSLRYRSAEMNCSATGRVCLRCDERNFMKGCGRPSSSDSAIRGQRPRNLQAVQGRDGDSKASSIAFDCRPVVNPRRFRRKWMNARRWGSSRSTLEIDLARLRYRAEIVWTNGGRLRRIYSRACRGNSHHTIKAPCNAAVKLVDVESAKMYQ